MPSPLSSPVATPSSSGAPFNGFFNFLLPVVHLWQVVFENNLAAMPAGRREVEILLTGSAPEDLKTRAIALCTKAFGTEPEPGVLTYLSRGTDDDAHGVLAGFGLTAEITRSPGDDGLDVVHVTLRKADLERIPESRIHTALEASLNCEVHIRTT